MSLLRSPGHGGGEYGRGVQAAFGYDDRAGLVPELPFAKPENRMTFFKAAEEFLAKHLGRRREP